MAYHPLFIFGSAISPWIKFLPFMVFYWNTSTLWVQPQTQNLMIGAICWDVGFSQYHRFNKFYQSGILNSSVSTHWIGKSGQHTQDSVSCEDNQASSTSRFRNFFHVCRENHLLDNRALRLSSWKSLFPTLLRPQTVQICVGSYPSTNGFVEIRLHQHQQIIRNVFHTWIWDPGIQGCESDVPEEFGLYICSNGVKRVLHRSLKFVPSREFTFEQISTENLIRQGSCSNNVKEVDLPFFGFDRSTFPWMYHVVASLRCKRLRSFRSVLSSYGRLFSEASPTTSYSNLIIKVMPRAFWSLSSKLLGSKIMKGGHSRFHLLAYKPTVRIAWLLSTLSLKLFQFLIFANNICFGMYLCFVNISWY